MLANYQPRLLQLCSTADRVLHTSTEIVKFPLSTEDKHHIADMIYSIHPKQLKAAHAPWKSAAGMAANQWGIAKRIFLFCPEGKDGIDLKVMINPSYVPTASEEGIIAEELAWEGCFSLPEMSGLVKRYSTIIAQYQNEAGEEITQTLSGFPARVFQHETDHLLGHLFNDPKINKCIETKFISNKESR